MPRLLLIAYGANSHAANDRSACVQAVRYCGAWLIVLRIAICCGDFVTTRSSAWFAWTVQRTILRIGCVVRRL